MIKMLNKEEKINLNWKALESMECPKCACRVIKSEWGYNCAVCNFKISEVKFNELINNMMKPTGRSILNGFNEQEDNLAQLNNL